MPSFMLKSLTDSGSKMGIKYCTSPRIKWIISRVVCVWIGNSSDGVRGAVCEAVELVNLIEICAAVLKFQFIFMNNVWVFRVELPIIISRSGTVTVTVSVCSAGNCEPRYI
jgi:hypothetical protein